MRKLRHLLLTIPLLLAGIVLLAQQVPLLLSDKLPDSLIQLPSYTSIYMVDIDEGITIDQARVIWESGSFVPLTELEYPAKLKSGNYHYWLQFQLENTSSDSLELIVRLPRLDSNFYYQIVDQQITRTAFFGNKLNLSELPKLGLDFPDLSGLPITLSPFSKNQIFIRTSDNLYLTANIRPEIGTYDVVFKYHALRQFRMILWDGSILGILFFVSIFSFFQYSQHKDKAFLFYALYIGFAFLSNWIQFEYSNFEPKLIQPIFPDQNYFKVPIDVGIIISYLLFVHYYINEDHQHSFLSKLIKLAIGFSCFYLLVSIGISIIEVRWSWILHYNYLGFVILLSLTLIYQIWKIKGKLAAYLFWGMVFLALFTIILPTFFRLNFVEENLNDPLGLPRDITFIFGQMGVLLEVLFFSTGLGYKRYLADQATVRAEQETTKLKEVEAFKDRLYTNLTHEFRTPLTVILGMANVLESNLNGKASLAMTQPIEMIRRNGNNLLTLVNQMLDLAKLKNGKMEVAKQQIDVVPYIKYVCESFESMAAKKQINWMVYSELEILLMDIDTQKLSAILSNLLSNAIKFTPTRGKVIVHLQQTQQDDQAYLHIKIKDDGIGIRKTDLSKIFDRFYQADETATQQVGGTGIGLALTKELVELMEGRIHVRSKWKQGTTFDILLPIKNSATRSISTLPIETINHTTIVQSEISTLIQPATPNKEQPLLLLIEDNKDVAQYLITCLTPAYQIFHAMDGVIGTKLAIEKIPDLIICDVMMPNKNGYEVCATLKADERTDHIPILLLTAKVTQQDRLKGLTQGADAYLTKPFDKEELLIRLANLQSLRLSIQNNYTKGLLTTSKRKKSLNNQTDQFIQKLEKAVLKHLQDSPFSANELAAILLLSRSQLHRKIKSLTGKSTTVYIRFVRLEKSKELLIASTYSISEIAYQVGFKSPSYFSQIFKETYGYNPSAFREGRVEVF